MNRENIEIKPNLVTKKIIHEDGTVGMIVVPRRSQETTDRLIHHLEKLTKELQDQGTDETIKLVHNFGIGMYYIKSTETVDKP